MDGQKFVSGINFESENRAIVFLTLDALNYFSNCEMHIIDGTFKITRLDFTQLYTYTIYSWLYCILLIFTCISDEN